MVVLSYLFEIPHPGMEETIKKILGIKAGEFDSIMAGGMELPDHLKERLGLLKKEASEDQFLPDFSPEELKEMGVYDQVYGDEKSEASMKEWPEHWLHKQDPLGWLQWYERYAGGRRTEDDLRQIKDG